jgi:hypothetical protein
VGPVRLLAGDLPGQEEFHFAVQGAGIGETGFAGGRGRLALPLGCPAHLFQAVSRFPVWPAFGCLDGPEAGVTGEQVPDSAAEGRRREAQLPPARPGIDAVQQP